jgi:response regulator RpfG family c-di-GMP phosphodiesterase
MPEENATILVIDDDPDVRASVGRLLRSLGMNVQLFASISDFLKFDPPNGPTCHVRLPGQSGLDLQREHDGLEDMRARGGNTAWHTQPPLTASRILKAVTKPVTARCHRLRCHRRPGINVSMSWISDEATGDSDALLPVRCPLGLKGI